MDRLPRMTNDGRPIIVDLDKQIEYVNKVGRHIEAGHSKYFPYPLCPWCHPDPEPQEQKQPQIT